MRMTLARSLVCVALYAGCYDPPVASPPTTVVSFPTINVSPKNKVDLLFMIDNSPSMAPMQAELQTKFKTFFDAFAAAAAQKKYADLQIGVVTSDFGAAGATKKDNGCDPFGGGQGGRLQALGDPMSRAATCVAPVGANFIKYNFDPAVPNASNLPSGQDLVTTFGCMAAVGVGGCGYEHQLESVYSALHDAHPENDGFLRPDARLAIVFLTNEDDGSAPAASGIYDTTNTNFGPRNTYRQTMWGVECANMLTPDGPSLGFLHGCGAASDPGEDASGLGKEFDVARYIHLFSDSKLAGGLKYNPNDVILVGIDALYDDQQGLQVILSTGMDTTTHKYVPCAAQGGTCQPVLDHTCQNASDPAFFGDPAVRLNTVIEAAHTHALRSICDNDYAPAMQAIADLLTEPPAGCVPDLLENLAAPECTVEDWTQHPGQDLIITEIPRCDQAPAGATCWRIDVKQACASTSPQSVGITVDRQGMEPPPDTFVSARCATVPGDLGTHD
jgi:hypothetical protein